MIAAAAFQEAVEERLGPLLTRYGFQRADAIDHAVRYERKPVFVEVSHDARRSYEIEVWIGRLDRELIPLELAHALGAAGCPPQVVEALGPMQTDDPEVLGRLLDRAVATLDGCGQELLREGSDVIERGFALRDAQAEEDERTELPLFVVQDAEAAWAAKDLEHLHTILHPYRDRLDATLRRRLHFAERRSTQEPAPG